MRFLVDAQLPTALARWLSVHGHVAEHVFDVMMSTSSDYDIWAYTVGCGAVIVTKDQDFASRRASEPTGPAVVWLRCGNTRRRELLHGFEHHFVALLAALERGENVVEVR
jgi:predicted nuclease of predicted toxin-antitoxin system